MQFKKGDKIKFMQKIELANSNIPACSIKIAPIIETPIVCPCITKFITGFRIAKHL